MNVTEKIEKFLKSLNIKYEKVEHEPTPTSKDAARVRELLMRGISEKNGAKAMVLRSKGKFLMCVLAGINKIDLNKMRLIIESKSLSFATPEEVKKIMHCSPGEVPPFGNLFNIPMYIDKNLLKNEYIAFNAGKQTISIKMKTEDYLKATKPKIEDFILN